MTFRTDGELIRAVNQSRDLTNLVMAYLALWKKHANGLNGVYTPEDNYTVVFDAPESGAIAFSTVQTLTRHWEEATYYDVDSDYFTESYGGSANVSGSISRSEDYISEKRIKIPTAALLRSAKDMEADIIAVAGKIRQRQLDEQKAAEIATLERQLQVLKAGVA